MQIIQGISEKVLIDRLIAGDQTAFELIFRHYYPGLVIFTAQITRNRNEAEEIVQDLFFRIWCQKNQIKGSLSLKPYLFTSVRNRGLNFLERKKTEARKIDEFRKIIKNNLTFEPDIFVSSELQEKISQAFEKLPPRTKEIFILSRINELKNDEIAGRLEISKRTVETQISHALKILKQELKDYLVLLFLFDLFF
ncbi:RNA polymerase sigma-70 factor [Gaoshiqia sp. Z1-71]|uniref:RNA polymerase sigma-70 factor n=1 Tax=Gaoshiqia hydrogeniformans TaxID=3290090 RepID=UPI003BF7D86C